MILGGSRVKNLFLAFFIFWSMLFVFIIALLKLFWKK